MTNMIRPVGHVALIGNFIPRQCGIATFTADLHEAMSRQCPGLRISTVAMTDPGRSYDYPCQVGYEIAQEKLEEYLAAAEHINALNPDAVCIQHEFGIFGGEAGEYLLQLTDRLIAPVVVTLHTVLTDPNPDQRRVLEQLEARASKLVVMTEMGRKILIRDWNFPVEKIVVIPHGIPDLPFRSADLKKHLFDLEGHKVAVTFGLLSPGKGIENMIAALPGLVKDHPDFIYVVLGATHPNLVAYEGEAYRERLMEQARSLGVENHLRFVNQFMDTPTLQAWLSVADIYVSPYLNEAQITSGTLSYAVGMGKAVVSTPYWHAAELLANGTGALVPFSDPDALYKTISELLSDEQRLEEIRARAYKAGRLMIWSVVGRSYLDLLGEVHTNNRAPLEISEQRPDATPSLAAIDRMVDGCGMLQHSRSSIPDRRHGYCLDDNARALMLAVDLNCEGIDVARAQRIITTCASFVDYAWNEAKGQFRNFMDYQRNWLEDSGSEDSQGRALWALGRVVRSSGDARLKFWATSLGEQVIPAIARLGSPRARAFIALGLVDWLSAHPGHIPARDLLEKSASWLQALLRKTQRQDWLWFEPVLAYDNARLPEALIRAGVTLENQEMQEDGLASLQWLMKMQTGEGGVFRPVGTHSFGREYEEPLPFDQQPVEGWATIEACQAAFKASESGKWKAYAEAAFDWYLGLNDTGLRLATADGGCFDGLHEDRVNLNQGAESLLAFQYAGHAIRKMQ